MSRRDWTRDELIVAFNLYCRIPFGRIHYQNPEIIALARLIGRSPSSVSWKLSNFARLDPELQKRGIRGATHGSKGEQEIWNEFNDDWDGLAFESAKLIAGLQGNSPEDIVAEQRYPEGKTRDTWVKTRVNQSFFRSAVIAAYNSRCCVTGLSVPELLTASHIVPWSVDEKNRTNPRNGLSLNAVHDRAFDSGLITITPDFRVRLSKALKNKTDSRDSIRQSLLLKYDGAQITLPDRFLPGTDFLKYHNRTIFRDANEAQ